MRAAPVLAFTLLASSSAAQQPETAPIADFVLVDKSDRALTLYATLEIAIAVLAVLMPLLLIAVRPLLAATYADGHGGATFAFVRLASSVLLLCVPAACMGATFPIASRWIVRTATTAAQDAGGLYAANALGAAAGAVMAGFALIPALGLRGTTFVGVALNVIAAAGAWMLASRSAVAPEAAPAAPSGVEGRDPGTRNRNKSSREVAADTPRTSQPWLAAIALGISGFASLTLQVVWTRLLAQILGPTTYAFSTVVAIFIIGIVYVPYVARPIRGQVLSLKNSEFWMV